MLFYIVQRCKKNIELCSVTIRKGINSYTSKIVNKSIIYFTVLFHLKKTHTFTQLHYNYTKTTLSSIL